MGILISELGNWDTIIFTVNEQIERNNEMKKRLILSVITGAVLGIFCIVGGSIRLGWEGNQLLLFALWYNRLILGLVIGLAGNMVITKTNWNWILRGAVLGLIVSGAYFLTSGVSDWVSFFAGIVYGVIIEYVLNRFAAD